MTVGDAGLGKRARQITRASAVLYSMLGAILFVAPDWSADHFGWKVNDFQAMTIGAWCLSNGALSFEAARVWRFGTIYPVLIYLWAFAVLEIAVLTWFRDKIMFDNVLFWPYAATLGVALLAALAGVSAYLRTNPLPAIENSAPAWLRVIWFGFFAIVTFLFVIAMAAPDAALDGTVFPDPLTPFTLRAFGVFYFALGLGALPLLVSRHDWRASLFYITRAEIVIAIIMFAAVVYIGRFDFTRKGHWIYPGAYIAAAIVSAAVVARRHWSHRRG